MVAGAAGGRAARSVVVIRGVQAGHLPASFPSEAPRRAEYDEDQEDEQDDGADYYAGYCSTREARGFAAR